MSFAKFLQGALRGATEQMPAAFERHDARKKFEQQMQMQQSQFASELGLKQQEVTELGRRNQVLEEYNRDQLAFNEKLEDARQRGETRQMMTNYITSTNSASQLDAIDLSSFHPKNVSFLQPLIDAQRQGLAYEKTVQMQGYTDQLLIKEADMHANNENWEAAIAAANQLSQGRGQYVKMLKGQQSRGLAYTPDVEMNLQLWNDAEDAVRVIADLAMRNGKPFGIEDYDTYRNKEFKRRSIMAGTWREPYQGTGFQQGQNVEYGPDGFSIGSPPPIAAPGESVIPAILPGDTGVPIGDEDVQAFAGPGNTGPRPVPRPAPIKLFEGALPSNFDSPNLSLNPFAEGAKPIPEKALWGIGGP